MSNIKLRNSSGQYVEYSGVTSIDVPKTDGTTATFSEGGGVQNYSLTLNCSDDVFDKCFIDANGTFYNIAFTTNTYTVPNNCMIYASSYGEYEISGGISKVGQGLATIHDVYKVTGNCSMTYACFVGDTLITLADNTTKAIKDITEGDIILSYDLDKKKFVACKVLKVFKHISNSNTLIIKTKDGEFEATINHPIYCNDEFISADKINIGDKLLFNGKESIVEDIEVKENTELDVFNLDVDNTNTYLANGFLVHNKPTNKTNKE